MGRIHTGQHRYLQVNRNKIQFLNLQDNVHKPMVVKLGTSFVNVTQMMVNLQKGSFDRLCLVTILPVIVDFHGGFGLMKQIIPLKACQSRAKTKVDICIIANPEKYSY